MRALGYRKDALLRWDNEKRKLTARRRLFARRRTEVVDALVADLANIIVPALESDPEGFASAIEAIHDERVSSGQRVAALSARPCLGCGAQLNHANGVGVTRIETLPVPRTGVWKTSPLRTFIAAEVSTEVRTGLGRLIDELSRHHAGVKWVSRENIHLTIKFLGAVESAALSDVCRTVAAAVQGLSPFSIKWAALGAFPNLARPRTIWPGLHDEERHLAKVSAAVENALANLGFRRESRSFHPHLTIGRVRDGRRLGDLRSTLASGDSVASGRRAG